MTNTIGYPVPEQGFNALQWAQNKVLRANQLQQSVLEGYKATFEDFWGVQWPPKGSRHTTAEMQQIINAIPQSVALDMLQDSQAMRDFINSAYPDALESQYQSTAFNVTIHNGNTIVIGELKDIWKAPQTETP